MACAQKTNKAVRIDVVWSTVRRRRPEFSINMLLLLLISNDHFPNQRPWWQTHADQCISFTKWRQMSDKH